MITTREVDLLFVRALSREVDRREVRLARAARGRTYTVRGDAFTWRHAPAMRRVRGL